MKTKLVLALLTLMALRASATSPNVLSASWTGNQLVPDNNASGVAFTFNLTAPTFSVITDVTVDLNLAGGWDGDIYAYLSHGSGFSVLLNRVGRTAGNSGGLASAGFNVQLSDSYLTDIHNATGNPLTGNYAPDGRNISPFNAVDTSPRNALLGSFNNLNPDGTWTLFFADVSPLAVSSVQSWTVSMNIIPTPEPGSLTLLGLAAGLGFVMRRKSR